MEHNTVIVGKVSVVIPTFKRSEMLVRAVDSVLNQTYQDIEVIVVDDNSPDTEYRRKTEQVMKGYEGDSRVKYIQHPENRNGSAARNTGVRNSEGEFIGLLDDDDEYLPRKVEVSVKKLQSLDDSWGACYTGIMKLLKNQTMQKSSQHREGSLLLQTLARNSFIGGGSNLVIRRSAFDFIGGFDESFSHNQDLEFQIRFFKHFKLAHVPEYLSVVHYEVRDRPLSYEDVVNVENQYLATFHNVIQQLPEKDQQYVYAIIALQRFKQALMKGHIRDGLKNLRENHVGWFTTAKYLCYYMRRLITHTSYEFTLPGRKYL
jgi:glycosyltransferase involved in cell wall biosynthesis